MYYKIFLSSFILWGAFAASAQASILTLSDEDFNSNKPAATLKILESTSIGRRINIKQNGAEHGYSFVEVRHTVSKPNGLELKGMPLDMVKDRIRSGAKSDDPKYLTLSFYSGERPHLFSEYNSRNLIYEIFISLKEEEKNKKNP